MKKDQKPLDPIDEVIAAWTDPGPVPEYHYKVKDFVREIWPTLADALDRLTK